MLDDSASWCVNCGLGLSGAGPEKGEHHHSTGDYISTYETTRAFAKFISFLGWALASISIIAFMFILGDSITSTRGYNIVGLSASLFGFINGLLLVMSGQFTRATIDTADNTGQILFLIKKSTKVNL